MASGGSRQYGYERDGTVVAGEAAVVHEIIERILRGESLRSIALLLNGRAQLTTTGREWSSKTVQQMIRSPRLAGAIITPEERNQVIAALGKPLSARRPQSHLLSGIARCGAETSDGGHCGGLMLPKMVRRSYGLYRCGRANCGRVSVSERALDQHVKRRLFDVALKAGTSGWQGRADIERWWMHADDAEKRATVEGAIVRLVVLPVMEDAWGRFDSRRVRIRWQWGLYAAYATGQWDALPQVEQETAQSEESERAWWARVAQEDDPSD